jgi:ribosomal protein S18 acetylase RimI-like enzyme
MSLEAGVEFRVAGAGDEQMLTELFADIDETFFRPHPLTAEEARRLCSYAGRDVFALLLRSGRPVAYGMVRGWDEGYDIPSLGIAVRTDSQGQGYGRLMMSHLQTEAYKRGAKRVRLRVHRDNVRARRLYESMGYEYQGEDRGELVMTMTVGSKI